MLNTRLIKKLQNEHKYFSDMLKSIEKIKKKTPGNGFAKMKCKEKLAELDAIFERRSRKNGKGKKTKWLIKLRK